MLEVLAVIEGVQKCLKRTFTCDEIESGILKDLVTDEDYDLVRVVSRATSFSLLFAPECDHIYNAFSCALKCSTLRFLIPERRTQQRMTQNPLR